ncbi:MAG: 3'(2'),5'-bisphosphate nucleotidase [Planctomycetota bacterium]|nr:MAG: 3'(2'),5'-bisphosphate nucleotidase [Planctomycetota bacterium]REJ92619.1 MAG: 3'(2'),5'-bisphosphate nucleotidase [Planctomycetota bacterium]REK26753.1 MAG: 3'(2'),5'-bisphosphate nucleotidase [Planctomycetota bacterium]REK28320.1 MAG: 3'(2'),5'-bisphosphate nucleotidase [Planctomycetota bacterium]
MSSDYEREISAGLSAVRLASEICRGVQAQITPETLEKKDRSPVTIADFASQAAVCKVLSETFPDDPIIGEEDSAALREADQAPFLLRVVEELNGGGIDCDGTTACAWIDRANQAGYCERFWTLDPIDGTKGFLRGGQYAVALALIVGGEIQAALLACPNLAPGSDESETAGCVFTAVRGQGTHVHRLGDSGSAGQPVRVSDTSETSSARFCESVESSHSSHGHSAQVAELLGISAEPVRLDSQAKYAVVARGEADIYLRLPTRADYVERIWDHAAGVLVVEEAGGRATDVSGKPLDFSQGQTLKQNRGVVVTNRHVHDRVLGALREVGVE